MNSQFQNSKLKTQNSKLVVPLCLLFLVAGCNQPTAKEPLLTQIEQLTEQNKQLTAEVEQSKSENQQLKEQLQVLSGLPANVKGQNLYNVTQVSIHRYTTITDSNSNNSGGGKSLLVYIQPLDGDGDKIKAAGEVDVQLWDLDKPAEQALLGQWHIDSQQLQKLWTEFLVINYRLKFDVSDLVKDFNKPLTVKIKFTDYLSGRVFEDQKVIKPQTP